jgi:hypothetical protein
MRNLDESDYEAMNAIDRADPMNDAGGSPKAAAGVALKQDG